MKKAVIGALFLLMMSLVSAQYYGWSYSVERGYSWIEYNIGPYFSYVLGGGGEFLFERVLLFFVIMALVFVILSKIKIFENNMAATWIVTLAVSLLSTRYLGDFELMRNVLLPYTILGVALSAAVPLIIYFVFVQSFESGTLRKILWIFFIVVFLGIWMSRADELGNTAWIYLMTGAAALIFLLADGTIRRFMLAERMKQLDVHSSEEFARKIRNQMYELETDYNVRHTIDKTFYEREKRKLQRQLKQVLKN